jgi:glycosyltransferase involved in cell wall biosynthesis
MSVLVVSSYAPARGTGRTARTLGLVRALATLAPVDLLHTDFEARGFVHPPPPGVRFHEVRGARGIGGTFAVLRARVGGVPAPIARGLWPELRAAAESRAADAGLVIADDPMAAVGLRDLAGQRPVVYSAQGLESLARPDGKSPARLRAFERRLLETAAETWVPSRVELESARELVPDATVRYVPTVVDVAAIEPARALADPPEALFVADFTSASNREALRLLGRVLPFVWESVPELRLIVAGRGAEAPRDGDPRVTILGFVDDLGPLYERASCALVPAVSGSGAPVKFVEALAHGVPVVSTPHGAAGLEAVAGRDHLEGEGPESLAEALVATLDPERGRALGAAARALAEREYSIESLAGRLEPAIREVGDTARAG